MDVSEGGGMNEVESEFANKIRESDYSEGNLDHIEAGS